MLGMRNYLSKVTHDMVIEALQSLMQQINFEMAFITKRLREEDENNANKQVSDF